MLKTITRALTPGADAISVLKADHRKVEQLFNEFESADDKRTKLKLAKQICKELAIHDQLESKIFYPETKANSADATEEINEGIVEHESIRRLIREIPTMTASDEFFETRMTVLMEYVKHHVKEEERSMFPKIVEGEVDLEKLGEKMISAKETFTANYEAKLPPRTPTKKAVGSSKTA